MPERTVAIEMRKGHTKEDRELIIKFCSELSETLGEKVVIIPSAIENIKVIGESLEQIILRERDDYKKLNDGKQQLIEKITDIVMDACSVDYISCKPCVEKVNVKGCIVGKIKRLVGDALLESGHVK